MTTPALGDLTTVALPTIIPRPTAASRWRSRNNSDEVTGATLNGGETDGTWTKPAKLLGVTGGLDGEPAMLPPRCRLPARSRAAASTRTRPTPVVSLTFGFFLRGKSV